MLRILLASFFRLLGAATMAVPAASRRGRSERGGRPARQALPERISTRSSGAHPLLRHPAGQPRIRRPARRPLPGRPQEGRRARPDVARRAAKEIDRKKLSRARPDRLRNLDAQPRTTRSGRPRTTTASSSTRASTASTSPTACSCCSRNRRCRASGTSQNAAKRIAYIPEGRRRREGRV